MVSQRTGTYFDPHVAEAYLDLAGSPLLDAEPTTTMAGGLGRRRGPAV